MADYHDFVIKDGVFVGKFEEMYQAVGDPWRQTGEAGDSYSRHDTILTVKRYGLKNVLEIGCGLGYFTALLAKNCPDTKFTGVDISETAVAKAKETFPQIAFVRGGVRELDRLFDLSAVDGIVFAEIMWYILDDLDETLKMLKEKFSGKLIVNQIFYYGGQKYGRDFFTTQEEMIRYFGFDALVKTAAHTAENTVSYETHTVFGLGAQ